MGLLLVDCCVASSGVKVSWNGSTLGGLPAKRADRWSGVTAGGGTSLGTGTEGVLGRNDRGSDGDNLLRSGGIGGFGGQAMGALGDATTNMSVVICVVRRGDCWGCGAGLLLLAAGGRGR